MASATNTLLQYASSETDADILYGSGFSAYDPFLFLEHGRHRTLAVVDFEVDRARAESKADEVIATNALARQDAAGRKARAPDTSPAGLAAALLRKTGIRRVRVPAVFPVGVADRLRAAGFRVEVIEDAVYPERLTKAQAEIRAIEQVQRAVERAMRAAASLLDRSRIQGNRLVLDGHDLRAEDLHTAINRTLVERGCFSSQTIVAPGDQAVDPHNQGSGPIRPGMPVVVDIFPRSGRSHYFADMTRTFVKGRPSAALIRQHRAVREAQQTGLSMIRPGVAVRTVHRAVADSFEKAGYQTGERNGRLQGFTHSTGHGVGLEIHEPPKIGLVPSSVRFRKGMVVTVEPGLYYLGVGGVRIEDLVVVTADGVRNLTRYPKKLAP